MAKAGADVLVPHMGLTSSGTIGARTTITLKDAALRVQGMHDAAKKVNPDSGVVDTCFSTATCMRRYRLQCPHADPATGRPQAAVSGDHMLRWPFRNRDGGRSTKHDRTCR
jgi:hypothetical protein